MNLADSIILDINGVPGSGKSLLSVAIAQAKVSEWKKELINKNEIIESYHTDYNFNYLKQLCLSQYFKQQTFTESQFNQEIQILKNNTGILPFEDLESLEKIDFYKCQLEYYDNKNTIFKERFELEYYYNFYLSYIRPMIISNMPVFDKINQRYSTIVDLKWFEQAKNNTILIEPYTILILDEIDKEWNTFSSERKEIIKDGVVYTIQMWRHLTKNRGVLLLAYQLESSLLFQIRSNAENTIKLIQHKKDTICSIPYLLIDKINIIFFKFDLWLLKSYLYKKTKIKNLSCEYNYNPKRFRNTAHNIIFSKLININISIIKFMNKYTVFKLFSKVINDNNKPKKKSLKINLYDINYTYNNTFFFPEHTKKLYNQAEKLLYRIRFNSLNPNINELASANSTAFDKFYNIPRPEKAKKEKNKK